MKIILSIIILLTPISLSANILSDGNVVYQSKNHSITVSLNREGKYLGLTVAGQDYSKKNIGAYEYHASIFAYELKNTTFFLLIKTYNKNVDMPKSIPCQIRFHKNKAIIVLRGKSIEVKQISLSDLVFADMLEMFKKEGNIIYTSPKRDNSREYYETKIINHKAQFFYYNRKNMRHQSLKVLRWQVKVNRNVDKTYANDFLSTFITLRYQNGQIINMEIDIERHPMSSAGIRIHKNRKTQRFWHFEQIEKYFFHRPDGNKEWLYGYRLDGGTQEYVLTTPEYPIGIHFAAYFQGTKQGYLLKSFNGKSGYTVIQKETILSKVKLKKRLRLRVRDDAILMDSRGNKKIFKGTYEYFSEKNV